MPVSPFGRQQGLFDDEFGDSRVSDATTLLLADTLNSAKPSDLRKVLATYNESARQAADGQIDMFSDSVPTKEEILTKVIEHFRNATPKEQQALVDAAIAERKRRAEAGAEQREDTTEQAADAAGGRREGAGAAELSGAEALSAAEAAQPEQKGTGNEERGTRGGAEAARSGQKGVIGRSLTKQEATELIARMEAGAEIAPELELTIENWDAEFGEDGTVNTPIGEVKMGENQFTKLMRQGRDGKLGMVKPTLENPDIIIEDSSKAKDGSTTERESSYVFVKAFVKPDGSRYYYFTSVTVSKDGHEVVISNQEKRRNVLTNLLLKGKLVWKHADNVSSTSDVADGLYSSQGNMSDLASEGTVAPQTNISDGKGNALSSEKQEKGAESNGVQTYIIEVKNDKTGV